MATKKYYLDDGTLIWWILLCIATFGGAYFIKLVIMKAIVDAENVMNKNDRSK
ncbi:MAG TPA: hypothetical protein VMR95_03045 [Candidatus Binatia bacterium]|jgi:hypothetical protein|nr:hypothetical protein [Candidatus Binatia bacterium]